MGRTDISDRTIRDPRKKRSRKIDSCICGSLPIICSDDMAMDNLQQQIDLRESLGWSIGMNPDDFINKEYHPHWGDGSPSRQTRRDLSSKHRKLKARRERQRAAEMHRLNPGSEHSGDRSKLAQVSDDFGDGFEDWVDQLPPSEDNFNSAAAQQSAEDIMCWLSMFPEYDAMAAD